MIIRPARIGEEVALSELALKSIQQAWGYSDEFMAWEPDSITVTNEHIVSRITNVIERDGNLAGFYVLSGTAPTMVLSRMMVAPMFLGAGCGRRLWQHAIETARSLGVENLTLDADPNAEPFYHRMGAITIGRHDWEPPMMPGWRLIKMTAVVGPA